MKKLALFLFLIGLAIGLNMYEEGFFNDQENVDLMGFDDDDFPDFVNIGFEDDDFPDFVNIGFEDDDFPDFVNIGFEDDDFPDFVNI
ncbi:MAG: hypothetical protein RBQ97_09700 [Acholeplasma sp.]|nr:hypothetical protein [Acholeplasma sp.]